MKQLGITIFLLLLCIVSQAQILHTADTRIEELFSADISTMSEFRERFNLAIETDSNDETRRMKGILSLFNRHSQSILAKQDIVVAFAREVLQNKQQLAFSDSLWFADILCSVNYKEKLQDLHLILRTEHIEGDLFRWALCGISGLHDAGIINNAEFGYIEPVDNELNFIDMTNRLQQDYKNAFGYKSSTVPINQLSIFLYLMQEHRLTLVSIDKIQYHFLSVPGYIFVVEQSGTPMNSGWLISDISNITIHGRNFYEKTLCGDF